VAPDRHAKACRYKKSQHRIVMTGKGIIKGMIVTAKNFVGSYYDKERMTTVQYPEERETPEENYRNFPFLVFDDENSPEGLRCTACKICEKECPPQCIYIVMQRDENGKATKHPKVFDIDISVCMSCQICVEVCPFESIKMDKVYELSTRERFDNLLLRKDDLAKSNEYYHEIRPTEASAVDAGLAEAAAAAEAKKKAAAEKKAAAAAKKVAEKKAAEKKAAEAKQAAEGEQAAEAEAAE
jgi:NADH-quinone oxidoreductase subunit I